MVYVIKRLKNKEEFNASKIEVAIKKAFFSCHKEIDKNHFDKIEDATYEKMYFI